MKEGVCKQNKNIPNALPKKNPTKATCGFVGSGVAVQKTMSDITAKQDIGLVKERATERSPSPNRLV